jgi:tryptophan synthase alpha chain
LPQIFQLVREFRRDSELPLILFGYFNRVFHFGVEKFCRQTAASGADGILCVDLPPEESGELKHWADNEGLDLIFLLSPTSGPDRARLVARKGRGFIYYVSVTGVTGARRSIDDHLPAQIANVRRLTSLPIGVGFGISTPRQAAWIAGFADAAVVGSALVDVIEQARGSSAKADAASDFIARLKRGMTGARKHRKQPRGLSRRSLDDLFSR